MTLEETKSELLKEWNYKRNTILPSDVTVGVHTKVWWICDRGHEWEASIANRYGKNRGCPYCSGLYAVEGENDLFTTNPDLEKEWNYKKNDHLDPRKLKSNSEKEAWWICDQGHEWKTKILYRGRGHGCPYCAGTFVLEGINDLETLYPEIAGEWDHEKNEKLPSQIAAGSNKKYWWKCQTCGFSYQAIVVNRTKRKSGCPRCSARLKTSFPEQSIYFYIKQVFPDAVNSYTDGFDNGMELDIFIPSIKIGIEYDGIRWHSSKANTARDLKKYNKCQQQGIRLIRIVERTPNVKNADDIILCEGKFSQISLNHILQEVSKIIGTNIEGSDLEKNRPEILNQYLSELKLGSLEQKYPDIAKEWDYKGNRGLLPSMFSGQSNQRVSWICPNGHTYVSAISTRIRLKYGCPICTGKKVLPGYNDLLSKYPEIASEWDYGLNKKTPAEVTGNSGLKAWWICPKGHPSYQSSIYSRTGKDRTGCPICSGNKALPGNNDLATRCPWIIKEWDYQKNDVSPSRILPGSNYRAWWRCSKGHEWQEKVVQRTRQKTGCPYCSHHRVIQGVNDLRTLYPEIAAEWNYKKNGEIQPEQFLPQSNKKVWWKCSKGHEWNISIAARQKYGCPFCSGRYAISGETDLKTSYPDIVVMWDYQKNLNVQPDNIKPGSKRKVYWKCPDCGYEWAQSPYNRIKSKKRCPNCSKD